MNNKGFEAEINLDETPNYEISAEEPLKSKKDNIKKVDINILKARAQNLKNKENRKNILILFFFLLLLAVFGIYLSV
tara:strand:+ start:145 stop:375 length:231 start_codon:yes stop_codon:yes gene_type:complete